MAEKPNKYGETGEVARLRTAYEREKDAGKKAALREQLGSARSAAGLGGSQPASNNVNDLKKFFGNDRAAIDAALAGQNLYDSQVTKQQYTDPYAAAIDAAVQSSRSDYDRSGQNSEYVQKALDTMLGGLGGYTTEEEQRFRESNMGGLNTALQTGLRQAGFGAANKGFGGGAAGALGYGTMQNFARSAADMERKLYLDNIAEKGARLDRFANYGLSAQQANAQNRSAAFQNMLQSAGVAQQSAFNIGRYNQDSLTEWELGRMGALMQGPNYINTRRDTDKAFKIQDKAASSNRSNSGGGGGITIQTGAPAGGNSYGWELPSNNTGIGTTKALS